MFDQWKKAWQDAVENFRRESRSDADPAGRVAAMRRDLAVAREELARVASELARARRQLAAERDAEESCRRREQLARGIGDEETARFAAEFGSRHAGRSAILEQKVRVLEAEQAMRRRDAQEMEAALRRTEPEAAAPPRAGQGAGEDREFRRLEEEARERAAAQRLEELKRGMR